MTAPTCQVCGGPLERRGGPYRNAGRWPKWCSDDCRRRGRTEASRARSGAVPIPAWRECAECRSTFAPERASQYYCSSRCRDRHNRAARRSRRPVRVRLAEMLRRAADAIAIRPSRKPSARNVQEV